jgi:four helix bundle protein
LKYTDLDVWKHARLLVREVYANSQSFPKEEMFGLTSQLRRAAISIPSNIAEGCGRSTDKDSTHFFFIARGSLYELETQLYLAFDMGYLSEVEFQNQLKQIEICKKLLNGFIRYFKNKTNNQQRTTNN